jgi:ubiquitin C-terminal hydrolase
MVMWRGKSASGRCVRPRRDKLQELKGKIEEARQHALTHGHTASWFVFFRTQASAVVRVLAGQGMKGRGE